MWRIKAGTLEVDLCPKMAAELVLGRVVYLAKARGSAQLQRQGEWVNVILPGDVDSIEPVRGMHIHCDEHGISCPE